MLNNKQLAIIHVAKSQLRLGDEEYRSILSSVCRREIRSSKEISNLEELKGVMSAFEKLGFSPKRAFAAFAKKQRLADSTISPQQIEFIETLWQKVTRNPETWRESLNHFLSARFLCVDIKALSGMKAINVIEALKDMVLKSTLVEIHSIIYGCPVVQNQLLEVFKTVKTCFSHEELAAIISTVFYNDPDFMQKSKIAVQAYETIMSHEPITQ